MTPQYLVPVTNAQWQWLAPRLPATGSWLVISLSPATDPPVAVFHGWRKLRGTNTVNVGGRQRHARHGTARFQLPDGTLKLTSVLILE